MRDETLFYKVVKNVLWVIFKLYNRLEVYGVENIPQDGGVIIAPNHTSYLDPLIIGSCFPKATHSFGKEELFRVPVLGWFIRRIYAIPLKRGGVDREAMRKAVELLKKGEALLLFPEGTRSSDGVLLPAKPGISMLAYQAKAAIIPVYISGSNRALSRSSSMLRPVKIKVYYGEPVYECCESRDIIDKKTCYDRVASQIMEEIEKIRNLNCE